MNSDDVTAINPATGRMRGFDPPEPAQASTPGAPGVAPVAAEPGGADANPVAAAETAEQARAATLEQEMFAPPARAIDYREPDLPLDTPPIDRAELVTLRQAAHADGFSQGEYQRVIVAAALAGRASRTEPWPITQKKAIASLKKAWGSEEYSQNVQLYETELARLGAQYPQIKPLIEQPYLVVNEHFARLIVDRAKRRASGK